ncbi:MAG: PAS domain-containing protein [Alphaproteobacteria bacterium]|nr:PAS domain-containing protein [Alphaproteobacteria bacterium]
MTELILTGQERTFHRDELIVSKTDLKGRITYGNRIFMRLAGYTERELLGAPHSIIRHPDMPRCVFKLLWDTLAAKKEVFAYVINRSQNGDHYWVFAHVTPSLDGSGNVVGYHSNRRVPDLRVLNGVIKPLYKQLLTEEARHPNRKDGMNASFQMVVDLLKEKGLTYEELIFSL